MKYKVTLNGRTYEVEVEACEAMLLSEYDAIAPAPVRREIFSSIVNWDKISSILFFIQHTSTYCGTLFAFFASRAYIAMRVAIKRAT